MSAKTSPSFFEVFPDCTALQRPFSVVRTSYARCGLLAGPRGRHAGRGSCDDPFPWVETARRAGLYPGRIRHWPAFTDSTVDFRLGSLFWAVVGGFEVGIQRGVRAPKIAFQRGWNFKTSDSYPIASR